MASPDRFLLAAVMGWPISQSRSPMLHNFWFAQHGLAGSYVPLAIPPERLEAALRALPSLSFAGCNLTIPLKQDAMRIVDEVDITAKRIGAISCVVVRKDGSLSGSNNDWYGFTHNILEFVPDWRADAGPVAVMGAGGGSRAVVYGLMERGAREIRLCNRTHARALTLAKEFGGPITVLPWEQRHDAIEGVAMLVNATNQGMIGQAALDLRLDKLPKVGAGQRHHLHPARDAADRGGARARPPHGDGARHAAAPGHPGVAGVVRHRAEGDGGAAREDRGDALARQRDVGAPRRTATLHRRRFLSLFGRSAGELLGGLLHGPVGNPAPFTRHFRRDLGRGCGLRLSGLLVADVLENGANHIQRVRLPLGLRARDLPRRFVELVVV